MKIMLILLICSQVAGTCMEPYEWPQRFNTQYDCLMFGYEESLKILKAFSIQEFEEKKLYTSFACSPQGTT